MHILAILGFSASGKDTVARILERELGYNFVVSATTRPKRSSEVEGFNYYYKTEKEFKELMDNNKLVEYSYYKTIEDNKNTIWHYGIEKSEIKFDKNNIAVVNISGLEDLKDKYGNLVHSIFLDVDEHSRRLRAIARDKNFELDEWKRRWNDDKRLFRNIKNKVDYVVDNYNIEDCVREIKKYIRKNLNDTR